MKLLVITQKINKDDPILGFFHDWIKEFSKHFEFITTICLEKGNYELPSNVKVLSLGKEKINDQSAINNQQFFIKFKYIIRFWSYIWKERKNYDAVFVHMNEEYILLGGLLWSLMGKKVYMWRNHHAGTFLTDLAGFFCKNVFCTSKFSYTAKYKKTILMPVGIDISLFSDKEDVSREQNSILFLGRIAPIKKPDLLIRALTIIRDRGITFRASVYGDPLPKDRVFYQSLKDLVSKNRLDNQIMFYEGIPNEKTVLVYNKHEIFVNLSTSGMYDKTIFEAMACGCLILASNKNLYGLIPDLYVFKEGDLNQLTEKIIEILNLSEEDKKRDKEIFKELANKNSLVVLGKKLSLIIK